MAYIDESGVPSPSPSASPCFALTAVAFDEERAQEVRDLLAKLRKDTNRGPRHVLHWNEIKSHVDRVHIADLTGQAELLTVASVVVCKTLLPPSDMTHDMRYLFSFRMLLERLSWMARDRGRKVHYTLAHIRGLKKEKLAEYKMRLFEMQPPTSIAWSALDGLGDIDQPRQNEFLQLADICASAVGTAFNPDRHGRCEPHYMRLIAARLYRYGSARKLLGYGVKLHPSRGLDAHGWVKEL